MIWILDFLKPNFSPPSSPPPPPLSEFPTTTIKGRLVKSAVDQNHTVIGHPTPTIQIPCCEIRFSVSLNYQCFVHILRMGVGCKMPRNGHWVVTCIVVTTYLQRCFCSSATSVKEVDSSDLSVPAPLFPTHPTSLTSPTSSNSSSQSGDQFSIFPSSLVFSSFEALGHNFIR